MTVPLFLFVVFVSVSVPGGWSQDYYYYSSNINTNEDNATLTTGDTTEASTISSSDTSQPQDNQTSQADTTAGTTTFPTQSPDVVRADILAELSLYTVSPL